MEGIQGKVAVVAGVGCPVGRAAALTFADEGAAVVAADPVLERAELAAHEVRQVDGEAVAVAAHLARPGEAQRMARAALDTFGRLDIAFNHVASEAPVGGIVDLPEEAWRRFLSEDLTGVFLAMKHEVPAMAAGGGGVIVNSASLLGVVGVANAPALTAAHHAVLGLTRATALEVADRGVRVNAVCSGPRGWDEASPLEVPGSRSNVTRPEDVAATVAWLASDAAAHVTGQAVPAGEGYGSRRAAPRPLVGY